MDNTQHNGHLDGPPIPAFPQAWADRFHDLAHFPTPGGVLMPEFDGDLAELHELADRVVDRLGQLFGNHSEFSFTFDMIPTDSIGRALGMAHGVLPGLRILGVADLAGKLLDAWRDSRAAA
jgi:hypothetical protein